MFLIVCENIMLEKKKRSLAVNFLISLILILFYRD